MRNLLEPMARSASQWASIGKILVRAGVVPRLDLGLKELAPLVRYGTTLGGIYEMAASVVPDQVAFVDDDRSITYGQLSDAVGHLAHGLAERYGIGEGSVVGMLARNHIGFVEALLALNRLGADVALLNTGMSPNQAGQVSDEQNLAMLIVDADLLDLVDQAPATVPRMLCGAPDDAVADRVVDATSQVRDAASRQHTRASSEPGRIVIMTSGTTGAPKGAQRQSKGGPDAAAAILERIPLRAGGTTYIAPPLFHTWGFAHLLINAMLRKTMVLRRRFDPEDAVRVLSVHRCSTFVVVPVMLQRILDTIPDLGADPRTDLSSLEVVAASGSALPGSLATRWQDATGLNLYNLYGSTEVSWATIATPQELAINPDTAGRAPLGTTVAILDDDGRPVPAGEVGRIFVGNGLPFEGYVNRPDAAKEIIDGLMSTGDMGRMEADGLLFIAGRDDDMIVSGGENVYPKEVEDLLASREDVVEAAVIGVDDEDFGQRLAAFVVRRDSADDTLDEAAVKDYVKGELARFSVPREVHFVDELPRNPTGKVVPRTLRSWLEDAADG